ncbi:hypothetical protein CPHO_08250 [Corynebacterium phocae]|uniref:Uncharacterized protein n=1 Tax=Corynebacterium phocae TaxID=161895 RepID=A0A1L7D492_9CORY|nr:hypothetical protein [Corynebacterium phocae]APT92877.1 hypothetical protein CPHO_08250 [Corynebacterium phocae]KAA8723199.1 hypothetical protein F4V58_07755 [Corynebacterium phocae]
MPIDHLPTRWQPRAYRLRRFLLSDSTALIILGTGIILKGLSYTPWGLGEPPAAGVHPAEHILPLDVWAIVWLMAGLFCLAAAFIPNALVDAIAVGLGIGLHCTWGLSFVAATLWADNPRGWVTGVSYITVVALAVWAIWRGKRGDVELREGMYDK